MDRQCCGKGLIVRRIANSLKNKDKAYYACPASKPSEQNYGCGFFRWEHEVIAGASWSSSSSPGPSSGGCSSSTGPSSAGKGSGGLEANCPNCRLLLVKIKILEAKLDLARHNEDPSQSAALQELLAGLDGILLDES